MAGQEDNRTYPVSWRSARERILAMLSLSMVAAAACSSGPTVDTGTKVGREPTATTPAPSPTLSQSASPSPSPSGPGVYEMGDTVKSALGSRITVYGWSALPTATPASTIPPPGSIGLRPE
jgi:hypothetical protein